MRFQVVCAKRKWEASAVAARNSEKQSIRRRAEGRRDSEENRSNIKNAPCKDPETPSQDVSYKMYTLSLKRLKIISARGE
jgi:hypothetical protein